MRSRRVVLHDADDPALDAAVAAARESFRYCWREVAWDQRRVVPGLDLAAVKAAFTGPGPDGEPIVEHMWVAVGAFDGTTIRGVLLNDPVDLDGPAAGTELEVPLSELEDWLHVVDGRVYGAHTVQLMRAAMGRRERKAHDRAWGLDFGEPGVAEVDRSLEHPMTLTSIERFRAMLDADPDLVALVDEEGWTMLHLEALAGNGAMVLMLLERGADPGVRTPAGETALDLARRVGWDHVATILGDV